MTITASCGHQVNSLDDLYDLQIRGYDETNTPCIVYGVYCKDCADEYDSIGYIIKTKEDERKWLEVKDELATIDNLKEVAMFLTEYPDLVVSEFAKTVLTQLNLQD